MLYVGVDSLMLYEFELGHKTTETIKNIYGAKGEGILDHSIYSNLIVQEILFWLQEPR